MTSLKTQYMLPAFALVGLSVTAREATAAVADYDGAVVFGDFDGDGDTDTIVSSPEDDCGKGVVHIRSGTSVSNWTRDTLGVLGTAACD